MAWIRIGDNFINLDPLGRISFNRMESGVWMEFYSADGQLIWIQQLSENDAERAKEVIEQATKAVKWDLESEVQTREEVEVTTEE